MHNFTIAIFSNTFLKHVKWNCSDQWFLIHSVSLIIVVQHWAMFPFSSSHKWMLSVVQMHFFTSQYSHVMNDSSEDYIDFCPCARRAWLQRRWRCWLSLSSWSTLGYDTTSSHSTQTCQHRIRKQPWRWNSPHYSNLKAILWFWRTKLWSLFWKWPQHHSCRSSGH